MKIRPLIRAKIDNVVEKLWNDLEHLQGDDKRSLIYVRMLEVYKIGLVTAMDDVVEDMNAKRRWLINA